PPSGEPLPRRSGDRTRRARRLHAVARRERSSGRSDAGVPGSRRASAPLGDAVSRALLAAFAGAALAGCGRAEGDGGAAARESTVVRGAVPVRTAPVARMTLQETVSGPGRTEALRQVRVRAPFTGTLVALRVAGAGSVVVVAQIVQSGLARVRPGQTATVELAARPGPVRGVVHAILPAASSENLSAPVRIDVAALPGPVALGLFGTARITVGK